MVAALSDPLVDRVQYHHYHERKEEFTLEYLERYIRCPTTEAQETSRVQGREFADSRAAALEAQAKAKAAEAEARAEANAKPTTT